MDYILRISGDFKKGECKKCFLTYAEPMTEHGEVIGYEDTCVLGYTSEECSLEEVKRGEWKFHGNDDDLGCSYMCPHCYSSYDEDAFYEYGQYRHYNFCPNCGAEMKGGK